MPELPEVEITRRGVQAHFHDCHLKGLTVRQPRLRWVVPQTVQCCVGRRLTHVLRRSKYLVLDFEGEVLVVHLGMSGSLKIVDRGVSWDKHDHLEWDFGSRVLRYNDPRRFGSVEHVNQADVPINLDRLLPKFGALGPEPFSPEFQPDTFYKALHSRKAPIKAVLLGGLAVVGVGNIYACEALFRAHIRPGRSASRVTKAEAVALHGHIVDVLAEAIERGGSTLRNFQAIDGELGHFQLHSDVYGREGLACKRCEGGVIKRRVLAQRGTFYCPSCQH